MDDELHLESKAAAHFRIGCETLHIGDGSEQALGVLSTDCASWKATGKSFKTPQLTNDQQRQMAWNKNQSELVSYSIEYSGNFLFPGTVEFRYRASSKLINGLVRNGVFKFYIDGIDQNVASDYLLSGLWMTIERDVTVGFHQMKWVYQRYINLPNFSMEDLAAELEYVKIKGVSFATKECSVCNKGVPNLEQDRCLPCMRNQYLDDLS